MKDGERPEQAAESMPGFVHASVRCSMTALAMIIERMVPMALGLGEGGETNAPLGRAVTLPRGLMFATVATLIFVAVFSLLSMECVATESRGAGDGSYFTPAHR